MEFTHEKYGKCVLAEITQKQLEDFTSAMKGKESEVLTVWHGEAVRNASKFEIMEEPKMSATDIDNASPGLVRWLSNCIAQLISEAINPDPLS